jgi:SAM-dependent methyltransferase
LAGFTEWLSALEARHLADLRVPEVTRALRALSSAYVERRAAGPDARTRRVAETLDTAGKRAAFALFYAPLHFMAVSAVVHAVGAHVPPPASIVDLGCGTGVAGAAWALAAGGTALVTGIDRHPWAAAEARWTYDRLGVTGKARQGDVASAAALRLPPPDSGGAIVAAYTLNELADNVRARIEDQLLDAAARGYQILIVEPISRRVTPWWDAAASRVIAAGGRADEWKFETALPPLVERFDRAAGLNHRINSCRSLYVSRHR